MKRFKKEIIDYGAYAIGIIEIIGGSLMSAYCGGLEGWLSSLCVGVGVLFMCYSVDN